MSDLVIVESPTKAKSIKKYLGSNFEIMASVGHIRDLPKKKMAVSLDGKYTPDYEPVAGKEELIKSLQAAAKNSDRVYLATDPDR